MAATRSLVPGLLAGTLLALAATAQAQPGFSKTLNPDTIGPGGVSRLIFTINNAATSGVTDLAFTDTLPPGVVLATPPGAESDCGGSVLTFTLDNSANASGAILLSFTDRLPDNRTDLCQRCSEAPFVPFRRLSPQAGFGRNAQEARPSPPRWRAKISTHEKRHRPAVETGIGRRCLLYHDDRSLRPVCRFPGEGAVADPELESSANLDDNRAGTPRLFGFPRGKD